MVFLFNVTYSVPSCNQHESEIKNIRGVTCGSLVDAFKLSGRMLGTYVVTINELAWDAVQSDVSYSDFASTFRGGINDYNGEGKFLASSRLSTGFDEVGDLFLDLYNDCILEHHNYRSVFERGKLHFDRGNLQECLIDIEDLVDEGMADELLKDVKPIDLLITKAQAFLEVGEYEKSLEALSDVIKKDPANKKAYFYRANVYFETGNFNEALKDYLLSDKGSEMPKSAFKATKQFTGALLSSLCQGSADSVLDFAPSLCNSAYGLSRALWAVFPVNPKSQENINQFACACYEVTACVADYCKNIDEQTIDGYVDQVKHLYQQFDQLNDSEKGTLIGYTIGKYGADLFAGGLTVKAVSAFRKLQIANQVCTLEAMAVSKANKRAIVASSLKHSKERKQYFETVKYNFDSHNKHVLGHNDFVDGKSIWDHKDPENLLKRFAGKGRAERGVPGLSGYKETIDFQEYIGIWKNKDKTIQLPTTRGTVHYGKKGAHIVPADPNPKIGVK